MEIYLAKTLENMKKYGSIFDLTMEPENRVETFQFDYAVNDWIIDNIVDQLNAECGTLLDDGDYDYISAEQCEKLIAFLQNYDIKGIPRMSRDVLDKLLEYAIRAVEYQTGIAIDL